MIKYRLHWTVHPEKDEQWYKNEIKTKMMTEDEVARELDINYALSVSGKVFAAFREDRHVISEKIEPNKQLPVYRIWDFGKVNCVLYGQIDVYGRRRVLHERVLGKQDDPSNFKEQFRVALNDSTRMFHGCEFVDICDPAGSFEDERGATPEVQELQAHGIYPNYDRILALPTRERKKRGRNLITNDLQETPGGKEAFGIYVAPNNDAGCPILKRAFNGGYAYKKDTMGNLTEKINEHHPYEDVIDCLIYWYLETDGYTEITTMDVEPVMPDHYINPYTGF